MAIQVTKDPIDRAVRAWMAENGIDERRVAWYRASRESGVGEAGLAVLELKMYMNDWTEPADGGVIHTMAADREPSDEDARPIFRNKIINPEE